MLRGPCIAFGLLLAASVPAQAQPTSSPGDRITVEVSTADVDRLDCPDNGFDCTFRLWFGDNWATNVSVSGLGSATIAGFETSCPPMRDGTFWKMKLVLEHLENGDFRVVRIVDPPSCALNEPPQQIAALAPAQADEPCESIEGLPLPTVRWGTP